MNWCFSEYVCKEAYPYALVSNRINVCNGMLKKGISVCVCTCDLLFMCMRVLRALICVFENFDARVHVSVCRCACLPSAGKSRK